MTKFLWAIVSAFFAPRCTICNWRYPEHQLDDGVCPCCQRGLIKQDPNSDWFVIKVGDEFIRAKK